MIDSHAHLYLEAFDADRNAVFDRARSAGVEHFVVVGIDLESSRAARELARLRTDVSATAGIHPNDVGEMHETAWQDFENLVASGGFVALGETGLDYHWKRTTPEQQKDGLDRHIALARMHHLPLVIHCRDAWPDLLAHLEERARGLRGIMHCFSGGVAELERSIALGFDVSFAGPLSYPKSGALRDAFCAAPADRIHIETDCPFLPPQRFRGQRNEPGMMRDLLETMAALRGIAPAELEALLTSNTKRLFGLS